MIYKAMSTWRDVRAAKRGRVPERLVRKAVYKRVFRPAGAACRVLKVNP